MNKYMKYSKILSIVGILLILMGVTYSFFNYTRTGSANTISVGRVSFLSSQSNTINLTNAFPIKRTNAPLDNTNSSEVIITITGDTTYSDGVEYLVSVDGASIEANVNKKLPIGVIITPEKTGELGTSDEDYYDNRGGNISIYKVLANETVVEDDYLLVGYIKAGTAEINGTIGIRVFIDLDNMVISDTYDGTESDENGTTRNWVNGRTVITTEEWNNLTVSGLSFKIRVEANEGIWVPEPTTRNDMKKFYIYDNTHYTNVNLFTDVQKAQITEIEFIRMSEEMINTHPNSYDLTEENGEGMVKAWIDGTKLYIASPGTTYFPEDSSSLFDGFSSVTRIKFNNIDTSEVTNMASMFNDCASLPAIDLSNQGSDNLASVTGMFYDCSNLTSINMSGFNFGTAELNYFFVSSVKYVDLSYAKSGNKLGWAFDGCVNLERVNLTGFDTSRATTMERMFRYCEKLTSIDVSSFNTSNVKSFTDMFAGCTGLKSINIDNFDFSKATDAITMFGQLNVDVIDLSKVKFSSTTNINGIFEGAHVKKVILSGNKIYNTLGAGFLRSSYVETLDMINLDASEVPSLSGFLTGAYELKTINAKGMKLGASVSDFISSYQTGLGKLENVDLSNVDGSLATSLGGMFSGVNSLKTVNLNGADFSNATTVGGMISGCSGITSIDLRNANFGSATIVGGFLSGVGNGAIVDLSNINFSSAANTAGLISGGNIISINFSKANFSNVTSVANMFSGNSLSSINLSNAKFNSLTNATSMFVGLSSLTNVNLTSITTGSLTNTSNMFMGCTSLVSLDLSPLNTSSVTNMTNMFAMGIYNNNTWTPSNNSLTTIKVGNNWNTSNVINSDSMFYNCTSLVGGSGTTFDSNYIDKTRAIVDGGISNPGYLT